LKNAKPRRQTFRSLQFTFVNSKMKPMSKLEELREEAKKISDQIVRAYKPERVILFGSLSNGSANPSDIDLLVIKETDENKIRRAQELYRKIDWSFPLDIVIRTPAEVEEGLSKGLPFYQNALKGEVLYEAN
jgi:predicted nucleotidyltransferase